MVKISYKYIGMVINTDEKTFISDKYIEKVF